MINTQYLGNKYKLNSLCGRIGGDSGCVLLQATLLLGSAYSKSCCNHLCICIMWKKYYVERKPQSDFALCSTIKIEIEMNRSCLLNVSFTASKQDTATKCANNVYMYVYFACTIAIAVKKMYEAFRSTCCHTALWEQAGTACAVTAQVLYFPSHQLVSAGQTVEDSGEERGSIR